MIATRQEVSVKLDKYAHYVEPAVGPQPVTVYDEAGRVKRVISSATLAKRPVPTNTQGSGRIAPKSADVFPTVAARGRRTWHPTKGRGGKTTLSEDEL